MLLWKLLIELPKYPKVIHLVLFLPLKSFQLSLFCDFCPIFPSLCTLEYWKGCPGHYPRCFHSLTLLVISSQCTALNILQILVSQFVSPAKSPLGFGLIYSTVYIASLLGCKKGTSNLMAKDGFLISDLPSKNTLFPFLSQFSESSVILFIQAKTSGLSIAPFFL